MIFFTLTLTYQQLILLSAINRGECRPQKKQREGNDSVYFKLSHFVTHATSLSKHGLIEHHQPILGKSTGGYTITRRGKLALELFKADLAEASTLNMLTKAEPKMIVEQ